MAGEDAYEATGTVIGAIADRVYLLELPNGHRLVARVPRRVPEGKALFGPGDTVNLELSPFDLSKGRILVEQFNEETKG